jgi:hypothetical protein
MPTSDQTNRPRKFALRPGPSIKDSPITTANRIGRSSGERGVDVNNELA